MLRFFQYRIRKIVSITDRYPIQQDALSITITQSKIVWSIIDVQTAKLPDISFRISRIDKGIMIVRIAPKNSIDLSPFDILKIMAK